MPYLFGDTDVAAQRLKVLAEVFAEPTRAFVRDTVADKPGLVLDLGCGPGHSTHLLADVIRGGRVTGLDNSERFISSARKTETERVSFHLHDVTTLPFPVGPADIFYCRLLLTHLEEPQRLLAGWAKQLKPGGLLLIEEVEWIHTDNPLFANYINIVEALLRHQDNRLYLGPLLHSLRGAGNLRRTASGVRRLPVANERAATMFALNMQAWKDNPFIRAGYPFALIEKLERDMKALAGEPGDGSEIEWGLRQVVFQRV